MTLGCPKNEVDTDRMHALVDRSPHRATRDFDDANVVVLNTCGFIEDAASESVDSILGLITWRDAGPGRRLIVTGCLVSRYGSDLEAELTEPDAFLSVDDESTLIAMLDSFYPIRQQTAGSQTPDADLAELRTLGAHSAYLQVSDGCFRDCAFCTIPSIRGPYRSRSFDSLLREAENLVSGGAREIVLIGQDISAWGRDLDDGRTLADLAAALPGIEELDWLRLMYVQPDGITDALLAAIADSESIVEYLDMPLQHVTPRVLRAMNRSGSAERFLELLGRIRSAVPGIALRSTFIAGFPGETDEDVDELIAFLRQARLDYVGVFPYSPEEGTPAASMSGLPDAAERIARAQRVRDGADEVSAQLLDARVGTTAPVMIDGVDEEGVPVGRLRMQAPEVDGLVYLDRVLEPGRICDVRLMNSLGYDLEGEVVTC